MRRALLILSLSALPALSPLPAGAETVMSAAEFEAWSTGKTLTYAQGGAVWGSEAHLAGRATEDQDDDGTCRSGQWFPQADMICFAYADSPGPYCWRFLRDGDEVIAEVADDGDSEDGDSARYSVTLSDAPLDCTPRVGV
jgi:hypothetical protein